MTAVLRIHVHPGARRTGLTGLRPDGVVKLEVASKAEDGRANRAVETLLAEALGVARARVAIVRGLASRSKRVVVEGLTQAELDIRIGAVLGGRNDRDAE